MTQQRPRRRVQSNEFDYDAVENDPALQARFDELESRLDASNRARQILLDLVDWVVAPALRSGPPANQNPILPHIGRRALLLHRFHAQLVNAEPVDLRTLAARCDTHHKTLYLHAKSLRRRLSELAAHDLDRR